MQVKIIDYGFSKHLNKYYVTFDVTDICSDDQKMFQAEVEGKVELKENGAIITNYYDEKYYPFGSEAAQHDLEDFIANVQIEMTFYLTSILEDKTLGNEQ